MGEREELIQLLEDLELYTDNPKDENILSKLEEEKKQLRAQKTKKTTELSVKKSEMEQNRANPTTFNDLRKEKDAILAEINSISARMSKIDIVIRLIDKYTPPTPDQPTEITAENEPEETTLQQPEISGTDGADTLHLDDNLGDREIPPPPPEISITASTETLLRSDSTDTLYPGENPFDDALSNVDSNESSVSKSIEELKSKNADYMRVAVEAKKQLEDLMDELINTLGIPELRLDPSTLWKEKPNLLKQKMLDISTIEFQDEVTSNTFNALLDKIPEALEGARTARQNLSNINEEFVELQRKTQQSFIEGGSQDAHESLTGEKQKARILSSNILNLTTSVDAITPHLSQLPRTLHTSEPLHTSKTWWEWLKEKIINILSYMGLNNSQNTIDSKESYLSNEKMHPSSDISEPKKEPSYANRKLHTPQIQKKSQQPHITTNPEKPNIRKPSSGDKENSPRNGPGF